MKKKNHFDELLETIKKKEERRIYAEKQKKSWLYWIGMSMFGMIGFTILVPTFIGLAMGIWIDQKWASRYSWTLILTLGGLMLGCVIAWLWIEEKRKEIFNNKKDDK